MTRKLTDTQRRGVRASLAAALVTVQRRERAACVPMRVLAMHAKYGRRAA